MSSKFRNVFLVFGVLVVVIMLFSFDMKYDELWNNFEAGQEAICRLYCCCGWLSILLMRFHGMSLSEVESRVRFPFLRVYKFTVSGFALNYVTPVGLMGGEPYRIMELTPYLGVERATSSVILYVMMHIFFSFLLLAGFCVFFTCSCFR
ncbi:MAG: flippase-like domain-containing protein [Bacteroides graminisolvens]|nr:flippase-like domain-containing protein [Bacteroides graminisolvens]